MLHVFSRVLLLTALLLAGRLAAEESTRHTEGLRRHPPDVFSLRRLRIVLRPGEVIEEGTILIRGRRIVQAGRDVDVPPGAHVIDFRGKTAYAGLIDSYSEQPVSTKEIEQGSPYWNRRIRPQLNVAEQLVLEKDVHKKLRSQGIAARLVAPAGGIFKGISTLVLTSDEDPQDRIVNARVALHARLTVSRSRSSREQYPNSPMGAVALARQAMYDADWHRRAWRKARLDPALPPPEHNEALDAIGPVAERSLPIVVDTSNELMLLRADRFAHEFGLDLIVKGSGNEYRRLREVADTARAIIVPLNFPKPPNVAHEAAAARITLESLMHWDHAPENAARLDQSGVRIALTSHGLEDTGRFLEAVRRAVHRGLPADAALRALTTTPAALFAVSDKLGTIEPNRLACLTIADGDLFARKTKIVETWVAGTRFEIVPTPIRNVVGDWRLTFQWPDDQAGERPDQLLLNIQQGRKTKQGEKLTARIHPTATLPDSDEAVSLKFITMDDTQLSGAFRADSFHARGFVRFTIVLHDEETATTGFSTWPDGTRVPVRMTPGGQVGVVSSGGTDTLADRDADSVDAEEAPETDDPHADAEPDSDDGNEALSQESGPASFDVNYPLGAFGRTTPPDRPALVVLRGATIWTCGPAGVLRGASLLIEDGVVKAIGPDVDIPDEAEVIDAESWHITPGIIDCHSHIATDGGVNESAQAITAEVRIGDFIDCDDISIYRQLAGGVTSSNILHGSANPIGGQNQVIKMRWGMLDEALKFREAPPGIKFALGENVKQSNWGDNYTTRYPQTRMGVDQLFRDAFAAAQEYAERHEAWEQDRRGLPPRRDLELDALRAVLEGRRWIHCHSYRQDEILALIRVLDELGVTIGTFQHILEGYKVADAMREHGAMGSAFSDWWAYKLEVFDAIPHAGALMHQQGIVVSFNSDDSELGRHLNQEAAKAIKYGGIKPQEALKFVTLNPAKQLRIDQYVGSLEPGKHADFVVWSGPPLSNLTRCEQTWIEGRKYFDRADDIDMRKAQKEMRNTLIQKILASRETMRPEGEGDGDPAALWPREDLFCHGHRHDDQWHVREGERHE